MMFLVLGSGGTSFAVYILPIEMLIVIDVIPNGGRCDDYADESVLSEIHTNHPQP